MVSADVNLYCLLSRVLGNFANKKRGPIGLLTSRATGRTASRVFW
jgi:hypothetical protein